MDHDTAESFAQDTCARALWNGTVTGNTGQQATFELWLHNTGHIEYKLLIPATPPDTSGIYHMRPNCWSLHEVVTDFMQDASMSDWLNSVRTVCENPKTIALFEFYTYRQEGGRLQ